MSRLGEVERSCHLFTFLGTGNYDPATYRWRLSTWNGLTQEDRKKNPVEFRLGQSQPSAYIQVVLSEVLMQLGGPVEKVTVFVTEAAKDVHFGSLVGSLTASGYQGQIEAVSIPDGKDEEQLWELFRIFFEAFTATSCQRVAVDITHGFRALSWFAASVLCFLSATRKLPEQTRVFYGLFERQNPQDAAVLELTAALDLVSWGIGLSQFFQVGRWSDDLSDYLREHSKTLNDRLKASGERGRDFFNGLNSRLTEVSDGLSVMRCGDLLLESRGQKRTGALLGLLRQVRLVKGDIDRYLPPLAVVLQDIERKFEPFEREDRLYHFSDDIGLRQLEALVELYKGWNRMPEATTVLREAFTTLFTSDQTATGPTPHRGETSFRSDGRHLADRCCTDWLSKNRKGLFDFRNDINHAGFNKQPRDLASLRDGLDEAVSVFRDLRPQTATLRRPVFLNFSAKPSNDWDEAQLRAAKILAPEIVDVPVPELAFDLPDKKVLEVVQQAVESRDEEGLLAKSSHALVMTDMVAAFALVDRLRKFHIECWTVGPGPADGNGHATAFRFRKL